MPSDHQCTRQHTCQRHTSRHRTHQVDTRKQRAHQLSAIERSPLELAPLEPPLFNRIAALMEHTTWYAFKGASRLAQDAGVSKSFISRLLRGQTSPFFVHVVRLTQALEKALGQRLDPREFLSLDGTYPTASVCQLAGCGGCLPAEAFDGEGNLQPQFRGIKPGQWSISQISISQPTGSGRKAHSISCNRTTSPNTATSKMQAQERR